MIKAKVIEVGELAISSEESLLVLFGESVTDTLKKVSIVQRMDESSVFFDLEKGHTVKIGNQVYKVKAVGPLASQHLKELGHVTLFFSDPIEGEEMASALYLSPEIVPEVEVGMGINYCK